MKILGYVALVLTAFNILFYLVMFVVAAVQLKRESRVHKPSVYREMSTATETKPVSILVPAYNEEKGIVASVRSLLSTSYPTYEVIVINDGSDDGTLQKLIDAFHLVETTIPYERHLETKLVQKVYRSKLLDHLYVLDKENGGKADALNAGINFSHYPYFCSLDGDSIIERDAFLKVMKPFIDAEDEVVVSGGSVRIANGCHIERGEIVKVALSKRPLVVMQVIEYLRAFLVGRVGLSRFNILMIVSGAFGVFHKQTVKDVGGYRTDTVGEDMELIVRLHRHIRKNKLKKRIVFVPDPVCWTEAPESLAVLRKQRNRWHRGLFESLWCHKRMIFNPTYGAVGMLSLPYYVFLELLGPLVELAGYLIMLIGPFLGGVYMTFSLLLFLLTFLYGALLSVGAVLLEEWSLRKYPRIRDMASLTVYSLSEPFWYRLFTVFWRVEAFGQLLSRKRSWGKMTRKGVSQ
nr:glycosyltransferase [Numidum massiliense]